MARLTDSYLEKIRDPATRLSMAALEVLSELGKDDVEAFQRAWPAIPVERRRQIVRAMGELVEDNVELNFHAVLIACIADRDAAVREAAIEALWEDDNPNTAELLLKMLTEDPDPGVRAQAASTLGHFVYDYEVEHLIKSLGLKIKATLMQVIKDVQQPIEVRRRALESISYISDDDIAPLLIWAYNFNDAKMHASAIRGMGRNCDRRWLPNIFKELGSQDPELRYEAARACGEIEDKSCVAKLIPLLKDPDGEVRLATIEALGSIGGKAAKKALTTVFQESDDPVTKDAVQEALDDIAFYEDPLSFDG